uniref:Uncharacterized protein n=1 Tax=Anopheles christyi TaxID=43041 RepID=A0A182JQX6_9DIPT
MRSKRTYRRTTSWTITVIPICSYAVSWPS